MNELKTTAAAEAPLNDVLKLSWADVEVAATSLIQSIREYHKGEVKHIIGLSKGGIVALGLLAQAFPTARLHLVKAVTYTNWGINKETIVELPEDVAPLMDGRAGILIVDDICDTGQTFSTLSGTFPMASFCALYVRKTTPFEYDHGGVFLDPGWVEFPWEKFNQEQDEGETELEIPF